MSPISPPSPLLLHRLNFQLALLVASEDDLLTRYQYSHHPANHPPLALTRLRFRLGRAHILRLRERLLSGPTPEPDGLRYELGVIEGQIKDATKFWREREDVSEMLVALEDMERKQSVLLEKLAALGGADEEGDMEMEEGFAEDRAEEKGERWVVELRKAKEEGKGLGEVDEEWWREEGRGWSRQVEEACEVGSC